MSGGLSTIVCAELKYISFNSNVVFLSLACPIISLKSLRFASLLPRARQCFASLLPRARQCFASLRPRARQCYASVLPRARQCLASLLPRARQCFSNGLWQIEILYLSPLLLGYF